MKITKFLPAFLILGILGFSSCGDDDDGGGNAPVTPQSKTSLVTAKNWTTTGLTVEPAIDFDGNGTQENNLIPFIGACSLDDFWDLNTDGTFTVEEGASRCDPNDPTVIASGTWLWNSDETRLVFQASGETEERKVVSVSSTQMVWEYTVVNQQNVTYTFTETMN